MQSLQFPLHNHNNIIEQAALPFWHEHSPVFGARETLDWRQNVTKERPNLHWVGTG